MEAKKRIAYCGSAGSFSEIAAKKLFPGEELSPSGTFREAYEKSVHGETEFTVLPLENSYAGVVEAVTALLDNGELAVKGVFSMRVKQNLLGVRGAKLSDVRTVISHPQALSQCAEFIASHGFGTIGFENTAFAAKAVADGKDKSVAAIASEDAAVEYGLEVLAENISVSSENVTRFAVLGKGSPENIILKERTI